MLAVCRRRLLDTSTLDCAKLCLFQTRNKPYLNPESKMGLKVGFSKGRGRGRGKIGESTVGQKAGGGRGRSKR